jgi:broad specificity phosphatase PhoE
MLTILLIRHGENEYTRLGKLAGRLPVPLNETGLTQAEAIAQKLASVPFQTIYASPLLRTMQTATPLATAKIAPYPSTTGRARTRFW